MYCPEVLVPSPRNGPLRGGILLMMGTLFFHRMVSIDLRPPMTSVCPDCRVILVFNSSLLNRGKGTVAFSSDSPLVAVGMIASDVSGVFELSL